MTVSCKNNKKAKEASETTAKADAEVVAAAKTILADDVLATLDEIAESFKNEENIVDVPSIIISSLTEQEKLIKPDYLLDAAQTSGMVTKSQKIGALAVHTFHKDDAIANEAEAVNIYSSIEKAKQHIIDSKDKFAARKSSEIIHNSITFFKAMPVNSGAAFSVLPIPQSPQDYV